MIEKLFPPYVQSAEHYGADDPTIVAHPLEMNLISKAVEKRRREFITTRFLARTAVEKLGRTPEPILRGEKGNPLWPKGIIGSMTHCDNYRAAAVAYQLQVRSLGIDAEPHKPLPPGVFNSISLPEERAEISALPVGTSWDRLLFCAKEATYKAWFPLTQRWLGFEDAHIVLNEDGSFISRILIDAVTLSGGEKITHFQGTWLIDSGIILTGICVTSL